MKAAIPEFSGFSEETFRFLQENRARNDKTWFEAHRDIYNRQVLTPLQALTLALTPLLLSIDAEMEVGAQVNKAISRIYRDTRFSHDKFLFRQEVWLSFKRRLNRRFTRPEFYFYATPEHYEYGMGYYSADKPSMERFKNGIGADPDAFARASAFLDRAHNPFQLSAQYYRKAAARPGSERFPEWMAVKTFCLTSRHPLPGNCYSPELAAEIGAAFQLAGPLYRFIVDHDR